MNNPTLTRQFKNGQWRFYDKSIEIGVSTANMLEMFKKEFWNNTLKEFKRQYEEFESYMHDSDFQYVLELIRLIRIDDDKYYQFNNVFDVFHTSFGLESVDECAAFTLTKFNHLFRAIKHNVKGDGFCNLIRADLHTNIGTRINRYVISDKDCKDDVKLMKRIVRTAFPPATKIHSVEYVSIDMDDYLNILEAIADCRSYSIEYVDGDETFRNVSFNESVFESILLKKKKRE